MANVGQGDKRQSHGPGAYALAFLSLGFRPFFLGAALFGVLAIGMWVLSLRAVTLISPGYGMTMWHMHEMLFGYGPAVLSGFLLTAVPNWTGRKPLTGMGLGALWLLWLVGRVVMMTAVPQAVMIVLDVAFLPVVAVVMGAGIVAAQNWRNLVVLGPIALFGVANAIFHYEASQLGYADYGIRLGLAALVFLITLIGGRIIPAFSRNWLVKQGSNRRPVGFGRFDGIVLLMSAVALALWVLLPVGGATALALALIAVLHGVRMTRWAGLATRPEPLLFVLHAAYAMIPTGLVLLSLGAGTGNGGLQVGALHVLGIGAIGGMTLSVMIRASLGHTGRALRADGWLRAGLMFVFASAGARVAAEFLAGNPVWIDLSAGLWMAGFSVFVLRIGPSLVTPRPGGLRNEWMARMNGWAE